MKLGELHWKYRWSGKRSGGGTHCWDLYNQSTYLATVAQHDNGKVYAVIDTEDCTEEHQANTVEEAKNIAITMILSEGR